MLVPWVDLMLESYALPGLVPNAVLKCKDVWFWETGPPKPKKWLILVVIFMANDTLNVSKSPFA
jgi:hypothetical protein